MIEIEKSGFRGNFLVSPQCWWLLLLYHMMGETQQLTRLDEVINKSFSLPPHQMFATLLFARYGEKRRREKLNENTTSLVVVYENVFIKKISFATFIHIDYTYIGIFLLLFIFSYITTVSFGKIYVGFFCLIVSFLC